MILLYGFLIGAGLLSLSAVIACLWTGELKSACLPPREGPLGLSEYQR